MNGGRFWLAAAGLLLLAGVLRFQELGADPDQAIGWVFLSDEGWWAHNARNHYLFGIWRMDDWNQGVFLAPLHTLLVRLSFEWFGLGLIQARIVSAAAGLLTIALVGVFLSRSAGRRTALCGMGIIAIDPFSIMYSRVALVDALPLALMVLAATLAGTGSRNRVVRDVAAGAVAMGAVLAKLNAFVFLPMLLVGVAGWGFVARDSEGIHPTSAALRRGGAVLVGIAIVALVWFLALVQPHSEGWLFELGRVAGENVNSRGFHLLTKGFAFGLHKADGGLEIGGFFGEGLLPVLLCLVWLLQFGTRALRHGPVSVMRTWTFAEFLSAIWLAMEIGSLWFTSSPDRRHLWMTVPCAILGAHALGHAAITSRRIADVASPAGEIWAARGLGVVIALVLAVYLRLPLAASLLSPTQDLRIGSQAGLSLGTLCGIAVAALCGLGALLGPRLARMLGHSHLKWGSLAMGIAVLAGATAGFRTAVESMTHSYELRRVSQEIQQFIGDEAAVAGSSVVTLLLERPNRVLVIHDRSEIGWGVYGLTHLDEVNPSYAIFETADASGAVVDVTDVTRRFMHDWRGAIPVSSDVFHFVEAEDRTVNFRVVGLAGNR